MMGVSKTNSFVFRFLHVLAWVFFAGLGIEAGALLLNFFFNLYKPEYIENLYQKLNLTDLYQQSGLAFFAIYGFMIAISILKAYLFYVVVVLMHKMDLSKPFDSFVSRQISLIGYFTISIGLFGLIASLLSAVLGNYGFATGGLNQFWTDGKGFILMGAIVYIIATIFKKGVDLQNEDDLTI